MIHILDIGEGKLLVVFTSVDGTGRSDPLLGRKNAEVFRWMRVVAKGYGWLNGQKAGRPCQDISRPV